MSEASNQLDQFNHHAHMARAFELAAEAAERGDGAFGSVLVRDDKIVLEDSNRNVTQNDIRRHPELHLAYLACQQFTPAERAQMVMYTSTEPCPMCAGGMRMAGFARVVYSVGADEMAEYLGRPPTARAAQILQGITEVQGSVCNAEGRALHEKYTR